MLVLAGAARHIGLARPSAGVQYEHQNIKASGERSDIAELLRASAAADTRCFKTKRDARRS
jgi:hypothetical protein